MFPATVFWLAEVRLARKYRRTHGLKSYNRHVAARLDDLRDSKTTARPVPAVQIGGQQGRDVRSYPTACAGSAGVRSERSGQVDPVPARTSPNDEKAQR